MCGKQVLPEHYSTEQQTVCEEHALNSDHRQNPDRTNPYYSFFVKNFID